MQDMSQLPVLKQIHGYEVIQEVCRGKIACLYKAKKQGVFYAIKIYVNSEKARYNFQNEVNCFQNLEHPQIISLFHFQVDAISIDQNGQEFHFSTMIFQWLENGDLHQYIQKNPLDEIACRTIFKKMLSLIQFLESQNIHHGDIKPSNILFDSQFNIKITDFEFSKNKNSNLSHQEGTFQFAAPEIFKIKKSSIKSQYFSLGVTLFMMKFGIYPFGCAKISDKFYRFIMEKNYKKFWQSVRIRAPHVECSAEMKILIQSLLKWNPAQRPSLEQMQQFEWFNGEQYSAEQLRYYLSNHIGKKLEKPQSIVSQEQLKIGIMEQINQFSTSCSQAINLLQIL